jgi:uncharacterized BrkB/YihY/UPF0761 family membrane protein
MKKLIPLLVLILILLTSFVTAIDIKEGVVFDDTNYNYTANDNFTVTSIEVTNSDLVVNGLSFCSWTGNGFFDTLRNCVTEALNTSKQGVEDNVFNGIIFIFGMVAIMVIAIFGYLIFGMFKGRFNFQGITVNFISLTTFVIVSAIVVILILKMVQ